jgi:hypothetical protein
MSPVGSSRVGWSGRAPTGLWWTPWARTPSSDWVEGLGRGAEPPADEVDARLGLGHVLRQLARDRATVAVALCDGAVMTGTIDRVGADALDIAEHPADAARRAEAVTGVRTVRLAAIATVRPAG